MILMHELHPHIHGLHLNLSVTSSQFTIIHLVFIYLSRFWGYRIDVHYARSLPTFHVLHGRLNLIGKSHIYPVQLRVAPSADDKKCLIVY